MMANLNVDDDLIQDYLAECREHLATIETDLLQIEQLGSEIDEDLVNQVFRAAHSIKGGAGFFGLTTIRELAHKTENVLELVRSHQLIPTSEIVSTLLHSFDKLRELIENFSLSNTADIEEFVQHLMAIATSELSGEDTKSITEEVVVSLPGIAAGISASAFDIGHARRGGKTVYLIEYDLIADVQRRGKSPMDVLRSLMKSGSLLETVFDLASAGTLDDPPSNQLLLQVLYATALEPDLIGQLVEVPPERIFVVAKDGTVSPLAPSTVVPTPKPELASEPLPAIPQPLPTAVIATPVRQPAIPQPLPTPVIATSVRHPATPQPPPTPVIAAPVRHPATPAPTPAAKTQTPAVAADVTVRLNITLLDSLMTLAGELVLSRNQLNEALSLNDQRGIRLGAQRVSLVSSELQEVVTLTRMRPLGGLFSKFSRLVRDLSKTMGKEVQLLVEGSEVEIDKNLLEGMGDPLTHMVRNAVDHGIESPEVRAAAGKPKLGTIILKAAHQAGQVVIEISDDGKGVVVEKVIASALSKGLVTPERLLTMSDREKLNLILLPGLSTAEKVTDISGRGVGMDVVKTNFDKLGGKIEIESTPGHGSCFRIKLPLTLAIIPCLLVSSRGERFAIPQANVNQLIRIPAAQVESRTDYVGDSVVLKLRDRLVPLLKLNNGLGIDDSEKLGRAWNIVLVDTGAFEYGLLVEELHDTVEIVVKPLGRHLQGVHEFAGATILGNGRVALILDVAGLATRAELTAGQCEAIARKNGLDPVVADELQALLLFRNGPTEPCAVPIELVSRVERITAAQVEHLGGRRTMQYRGASLPLLALHDVACVDEISDDQQLVVIVFETAGKPLGLLAAEPVDMLQPVLVMDSVTLRQPGVAGSALIEGQTTLMVDIFELANLALPDSRPLPPPPAPVTATEQAAAAEITTVLLAEDSDFFRGQIQRLMEAVGYRVLAVEDGQKAWDMLDRRPNEVSLVATDIEMPTLDGLALTRRIRADKRFAGLPVIALSSLSGEEEIARGFAAGITEYHVKLDQEQLLDSLQKALENSPHHLVGAL